MKSSILRPLVLVLPEAAAPCAKGLRQILCEEIDVAPSDLLDMQATADVQTLTCDILYEVSPLFFQPQPEMRSGIVVLYQRERLPRQPRNTKEVER